MREKLHGAPGMRKDYGTQYNRSTGLPKRDISSLRVMGWGGGGGRKFFRRRPIEVALLVIIEVPCRYRAYLDKMLGPAMRPICSAPWYWFSISGSHDASTATMQARSHEREQQSASALARSHNDHKRERTPVYK